MRFFRDASCIVVMLSMIFWAAPLCAAVVTVHGRVGDAATGKPIASALVRVYAPYDDAQPTASVETTTDGAYAWTGDLNEEQLVRLTASAFGHYREDYYFDPSSSDVEKDFSLFPASVAGIVRDAAGAPVRGVIVQAWIRNEDSSGWVVDRRIVTAADGMYMFMDLSPGTYRICAGGMLSGLVQECYDGLPVGHLSDIDTATPIVLGDGETRHDIDFALTAGASLAGTLTDERSGDAIAYADVAFELYDATGNLIDKGKELTDAAGAYRLDGVPSGTFRIAARVSANGLGGKQLYSGIDCPTNDCAPINAGDAIMVAGDGSVEGINFSFGPEAIIRGRVTDTVDGAPVPNAWVGACYNDPFIILTYCYFHPYSDAEGRYELAVNARSYFILTSASNYIDQVYPDAPCIGRLCNPTYGYGGSVAAESGEEVEGIDFPLQRSSTLSGRVVDSKTGAPLARVNISGYDANFEERWTASTDQDGRYVGGKWFAGTYYVRAYQGNGQLSQCVVYLDRPCPPYPQPISAVVPTPVPLAAGERREGIDFMLKDIPIFIDGFENDAAAR